MRAGYTIECIDEVDKPNCILVANYHGPNEVVNFKQNYRTITAKIQAEKKAGAWHGNDVGIWRIKHLK